MHNKVLPILLLMSIAFATSVLRAANTNGPNEIDKKPVSVNYPFPSPYLSEFVDTLSDAVFVVIEAHALKDLYKNAQDRTKKQLLKQLPSDEKLIDGYCEALAKVNSDSRIIDRLGQHVFWLETYQYDAEDQIPGKKIANKQVIMISEKALFTFLQLSYGIKRTGEKAEIMLDAEGKKTMEARYLLRGLINKYRDRELSVPSKNGHQV